MADKKRELLQYLMNKETMITSAQLQKVLCVSRRTINNYINEINTECDGLIVSSQQGYKIVNNKKAISLISQNRDLDLDYDERKKVYLYKMILGNERLDMDDIVDSMFISNATLQNDLMKLKQELNEAKLYIKVKSNSLYLVGSYNAKRKYIMSLLNEEIKNNYFNLESIQSLFQYVDVKQIKEIVVESLEEKEFFMDDYSLLNYVLHLSVFMETIINSSDILEVDDRINRIEFNERLKEIVQDIRLKLIDLYHVSFSLDSILNVSIPMSTKAIAKNYDKMTYAQMNEVLGEKTTTLVNDIIYEINTMYGIDIKEDSFMVRFAVHVHNLIMRIKNNVILPSNQFITMQNDYPFLYYISRYIGSIIQDRMNIHLNDTEISYIALHLGVLMEEKQNIQKNINCAIVIFDYYNSGELLFEKIASQINGLYLMTIVNSYAQLKTIDSIDLVITTLPIDPSIDMPIIQVNMIPSKNDMANLYNKINELRNKLSTKEIEINIRKFFKKELFFFTDKINHRNEAIDFICNQMADLGYVESIFIESIYSREHIVSSAFHDIALPHPANSIDENIHHSSIAVMISPSPIQWADSDVNFVFLIALKKDDMVIFKEVFDMLIKSLNDTQMKKQLYQCRDYEQFINTLIYAYTISK